MTPREILQRGGRALLGGRYTSTGPGGALALDLDAACAMLEQRFFVGCSDQARTLAWLHTYAPATVSQMREDAARLRQVGAVVFGRTVPLLDGALDWTADPTSGRRWPNRPLDEAAAVAAAHSGDFVGVDVKYVWELNRHQFLAGLGCAAWLDDAADHAGLAARLVDGWITQNPVGTGINWASPLEIGVRAIAWLWAMSFLLASPRLEREVKRRWVDCLAQHYDQLRHRLSLYTDPTNHLIGEATALWMMAVVMPGLPGAAVQRARALAVLDAEAERQVAPDGVTQEQATGYHCFVLEFFLQVIALARRVGEPVPQAMEARVARMVDFLGCMVGSGGTLPQIGDWDDGCAIPLVASLGTRVRAEALVDCGARLFGQALPPTIGARAHCLAAWLLGPEAAVAPAGVRPLRSRVFRHGGYAFMEAEAADGQRTQLIFDCGGFGTLTNAGHAHADALSVLIRVNGTLVLGDPGSGTYTASRVIRDTLRSTAVHNTVTVDGLSQADALDTFKWVNIPRVELRHWASSVDFDYAAAVHDGYGRLKRPVVHHREVLFLRPHYWLIVDRLTGTGRHTISRHFLFSPEIAAGPVQHDQLDAVASATGDGLRFLLRVTNAANETVRLEAAPWAKGYAQWHETTRLVAEYAGELPVTLLTVVVPISQGRPACVTSVRPFGAGQAVPRLTELCRLGVECTSDTFEDCVTTTAPNAESHARTVVVRRAANGDVIRQFDASILA